MPVGGLWWYLGESQFENELQQGLVHNKKGVMCQKKKEKKPDK